MNKFHKKFLSKQIDFINKKIVKYEQNKLSNKFDIDEIIDCLEFDVAGFMNEIKNK